MLKTQWVYFKTQWFNIILFVFLAADDTDCADFNARILGIIPKCRLELFETEVIHFSQGFLNNCKYQLPAPLADGIEGAILMGGLLTHPPIN